MKLSCSNPTTITKDLRASPTLLLMKFLPLMRRSWVRPWMSVLTTNTPTCSVFVNMFKNFFHENLRKLLVAFPIQTSDPITKHPSSPSPFHHCNCFSHDSSFLTTKRALRVVRKRKNSKSSFINFNLCAFSFPVMRALLGEWELHSSTLTLFTVRSAEAVV